MLLLLGSCTTDTSTAPAVRHLAGATGQLAQGQIESYADIDTDGVPLALGISFSDIALEQPPAVAVSGYYPTNTCTRYDVTSRQTTISPEDFIYREASP